MPAYLSPSELNNALTIRDLSNPDGGPHAMQTLLQGAIDAFGGKWGVPERIVRHSPLVSVADNYDRLGFNKSDVTRDQRYSRYVSPTVMLRSHTSASIPSLLRALDPDESIDELWAIPGLVYRRDSIDRTQVGTPHQVDLWRVSSREALDSGDLQEMIASLVQAVIPGRSGEQFRQFTPTPGRACSSMYSWTGNGSNSRSADSWPHICSPRLAWIPQSGRDWLWGWAWTGP
ncbi:hypothetical protein GCM10027038_19630 [Arthrobacter bambusae]